MNKYITAAFGILILLVVGFAAGRWFVGVKHQRTIETVGVCMTHVTKDRTAITLRIAALSENAAASMRAAQSRYAILSEYMKNITDDSLEMQTVRFDTFEKNEWNPTEQKTVSMGFETNIELSVSSKERSTIEKILGDASNMENVHPGNLRMFASPEKIKPAVESCIKTAVENAREKAESIADADGEKIGKMISAEFARNAGGFEPQPRMMKMMSADFAGGAPELFATDSEVSVHVSATFELK